MGNMVAGDFAFLGSGASNDVSGAYASIVAGQFNTASGEYVYKSPAEWLPRQSDSGRTLLHCGSVLM